MTSPTQTTPIVQITVNELNYLLQSVTNTALTADIVTNMDEKGKMNKRGNRFFGLGITKHQTHNGIIGFKYSNSVNNQLGREDKELTYPTFTAQPRKWGNRIKNLVEYNGKWYMELKIERSTKPVYFNGNQEITGAELEELLSFIPEKTSPHTQDMLDKKVVMIDVKLSNIKRVRMLGAEYEIIFTVNTAQTTTNNTEMEAVTQ